MANQEKITVAVIGLGSMGLGMAQSMVKRGTTVAGFDVKPDAIAKLVKCGGAGAATAAAAAMNADVTIVVVVNAAQTDAVLFGGEGAAAVMKRDGVIVACATMAPDDARRLAAKAAAQGLRYLDAPISGGPIKAAAGQLTVMASGSPEAFARARPALDAIAGVVHELGGDAGIAAAYKMVNQLLAGVHIAAACEAIAFAAQSVSICLRSTKSSRPRRAIPGCLKIASRISSTATTDRAAPWRSSPRI